MSDPIRLRIRYKGRILLDSVDHGAVLRRAEELRRDGEVVIQHNAYGGWMRYAHLCQWPPAGRTARGEAE